MLTERQRITYILKKTAGIGCVKGRKILEVCPFDSLEDFLSAVKRSFPSEYADIAKTAEDTDFAETERLLREKEIVAIAIFDENYPEKLLELRDAPLMLYCKGDTELLEKPSMAVIGTRFPTWYGTRATNEFVSYLSERYVIVSGMARGVDGIAHRRALDCGGKTVAVLGCGVDIVYPPENLTLYRDIISNGGLVVSEYEPSSPAAEYNFPARNRIISGLATGVLVTEAGRRSGTMLTVKKASEQNKPVFCVPGSIFSERSDGVNRCIADGTGRAVANVNDIFSYLGEATAAVAKKKPVQLDFDRQMIVNLLRENGEMHVEELLDATEMQIARLNSLLVKMNAEGLINKTKQNYWSV